MNPEPTDSEHPELAALVTRFLKQMGPQLTSINVNFNNSIFAAPMVYAAIEPTKLTRLSLGRNDASSLPIPSTAMPNLKFFRSSGYCSTLVGFIATTSRALETFILDTPEGMDAACKEASAQLIRNNLATLRHVCLGTSFVPFVSHVLTRAGLDFQFEPFPLILEKVVELVAPHSVLYEPSGYFSFATLFARDARLSSTEVYVQEFEKYFGHLSSLDKLRTARSMIDKDTFRMTFPSSELRRAMESIARQVIENIEPLYQYDDAVKLFIADYVAVASDYDPETDYWKLKMRTVLSKDPSISCLGNLIPGKLVSLILADQDLVRATRIAEVILRNENVFCEPGRPSSNLLSALELSPDLVRNSSRLLRIALALPTALVVSITSEVFYKVFQLLEMAADLKLHCRVSDLSTSIAPFVDAAPTPERAEQFLRLFCRVYPDFAVNNISEADITSLLKLRQGSYDLVLKLRSWATQKDPSVPATFELAGSEIAKIELAFERAVWSSAYTAAEADPSRLEEIANSAWAVCQPPPRFKKPQTATSIWTSLVLNNKPSSPQPETDVWSRLEAHIRKLRTYEGPTFPFVETTDAAPEGTGGWSDF